MAVEPDPSPETVESPAQASALEPTSDERQWGMFAHLSALIGSLVGGMTWLGPLIIFLAKREESRFVADHAREALNFQISVLIYVVASIPLVLLSCGLAFPIPLAIGVFGMVMSVVAALQANEGKMYQYPLCLRLIK